MELEQLGGGLKTGMPLCRHEHLLTTLSTSLWWKIGVNIWNITADDDTYIDKSRQSLIISTS